MAEILPFRSWRYDPQHVKLEDVLTQPYDKITPRMQEKYYDASAYNLVRVELGLARPEDDAGQNVYTRAAESLARWRQIGVLRQDAAPSLYAYSQVFEAPGEPGKRYERRGFIGACHLKDYAENVVFRHEQTLSKPKTDRLNLVRTARVNTGQIFMLYPDPEHQVEKLVWDSVSGLSPDSALTDEYEVEHRLWPISEPAVVSAIRDAMAERRLIIADGHHRYETALTYRNERRLQELDEGKTLTKIRTGEMPVDTSLPYEYVMCTFVGLSSPGLVILPTHRVVFGLAAFDGREMFRKSKEFFTAQSLPANSSVAALLQQLRLAGDSGPAFIAVVKDEAVLLRPRMDAIANALNATPRELRALDVTILHSILLQRVLAIGEEDVRNQTYLNYLRSAEEAVQRVQDGANVAFLMNPVRMQQLEEVAFSGQVMPQKSTDFYPKMLSGFTIYALD